MAPDGTVSSAYRPQFPVVLSGKMNLRGKVRAGLETGLEVLGVGRWNRHRLRSRVVILAYHNIVPRGESIAGERSLHLRQEVFAAQLDLLKSTHDVIPLEHLGQPLAQSAKRPRAVITWDDAYQGAVTAGVAEVTERNLPATIFACPGRLGGEAFWWDRLAQAAGGILPAEVRDRALEVHLGDDAAIVNARRSEAVGELPPHARSATVEELRFAAAQPRITVASHTWSHPNLTRIAGDRLDRELVESLSWLRREFPQQVPWLSYPYGLHNASVRSRAAAAGYQGAVGIRGGWVSAQDDRYAIPRFNVSAGLSLRGFALRLAGLFCS